MKTRWFMALTALFLGLLGLPCVFAADIVLTRLTGGTTPGGELLVQTMGALYFGFAGLNWMGKANLIGGIYGRPVAIANFMHFLVAGLALIKAAPSTPPGGFLWPLSIAYLLFAAAFGLILFRAPASGAAA